MTAALHSFLLVFVSEMGDKTQLLALVLASRFKQPWVIMGGILLATLLNHGLASWAGGWLGDNVQPEWLKWSLAAIFIFFAGWILIPDKNDERQSESRWGAFVTTVVAFFLAEMGDKTQLATVALGARFHAPVQVTLGTTFAMLAADGLAVFLGERLTAHVPMKWIRWFAAVLFLAFGLYILIES